MSENVKGGIVGVILTALLIVPWLQESRYQDAQANTLSFTLEESSMVFAYPQSSSFLHGKNLAINVSVLALAIVVTCVAGKKTNRLNRYRFIVLIIGLWVLAVGGGLQVYNRLRGNYVKIGDSFLEYSLDGERRHIPFDRLIGASYDGNAYYFTYKTEAPPNVSILRKSRETVRLNDHSTGQLCGHNHLKECFDVMVAKFSSSSN